MLRGDVTKSALSVLRCDVTKSALSVLRCDGTKSALSVLRCDGTKSALPVLRVDVTKSALSVLKVLRNGYCHQTNLALNMSVPEEVWVQRNASSNPTGEYISLESIK